MGKLFGNTFPSAHFTLEARPMHSSRTLVVATVVAFFYTGLAAVSSRASVLTFETSPQADYPVAKLFDDPTSGGFSDYGDRVVGSSQTGVGPGGAYDYSYGTAGGDTPNVVASYPGR